jgi:serine/threonine-protein kinase RsbW
MDTRRVSVPGTSVGVQAALEALSALWADHGLSRAVTWPVEIAVDELLADFLLQALEGRGVAAVDLELTLDVQADPPACEIVLSDDGPELDPLLVAEAHSAVAVEEEAPGALGLALVRRLMDEVSYERRDGRNRLRLLRRLVPLEA